MTQEFITYEQPINELVRVCLRLEHLFLQLDLHVANDPAFHTRDVVRLTIEILNVLDRPDLKSKFTQEFHRLISLFSRLHDQPKISRETLESTLKQLRELLDYLANTRGKIAQNLRDNEFVSNIRLHLLTPGGDCCFETPSYHYWLQQSSDLHVSLLSQWLEEFKEIRAAVSLLLSIVRNSAEPKEEMAERGFYHGILNTQAPGQLVRVSLPADLALYPEISVGKHRLNVRFVIPTTTERPKQTEDNVEFHLTICNI